MDIELPKQVHMDGVPLPLSALRLLVPPVRLMSAFMWRIVQQKDVMQYGMLADFVSLVSEAVPELVSHRLGVQLILGLRARLVLELCERDNAADVHAIQTHLNSIQLGDRTVVGEAGVRFEELVQTLIKDVDEKEHFFQHVFPVDFSSDFDSAIQVLMWHFLSKLENFLPIPDLQQTLAWLDPLLPVSEDGEEFNSQSDHLKTLLEHHKNLGHLDTKYSCQAMSAGNCILSTLSGKASEIHQKRAGHVHMFDRQTSDLKSAVEVLGASECTENLVGPDEVGEHIITESECARGVGLNDSVLTLPEDHRSTNVTEKSVSNTEQLEFLSPFLATPSVPVHKTIMGKRRCAQKPKTMLKIKVVSLQKLKRKSEMSKKAYGTNLQHQAENKSDPIDKSDCTSDNTNGSSRTYSCLQCPFSHSQEETLTSHIQKVHSNEVIGSEAVIDTSLPNSCHVCGKSYRFPCLLKVHQRTHTRERPFICPVSKCGRSFSHSQALRRHRLVHAPNDVPAKNKPQKPESQTYDCLYCVETFSSLSARRDHHKTHPEEAVHRCNVCGKQLSCQAALIRHKRIHTEERPFKCTECQSSFICSTSYKRHQLTHQPERPFLCTCGKGFTYRGALLAHQRIHLEERPYRCVDCGKGFLYPGALAKHQRTHSKEKPSLNAHCGKNCTVEKSLCSHSDSHGTEKTFKCTLCDKSFAFKASLTRHKLTHTGERPFLCADCGKAFFSFGELLKHQRYHTGHKPFQCPDCKKSFTQACYLQVHMRHHTGIRPYSCSQCNKSFFSSCRLKRHLRIHTGEKPFQCLDCGKRFQQSYHLKVHFQTHVEKRSESRTSKASPMAS